MSAQIRVSWGARPQPGVRGASRKGEARWEKGETERKGGVDTSRVTPITSHVCGLTELLRGPLVILEQTPRAALRGSSAAPWAFLDKSSRKFEKI